MISLERKTEPYELTLPYGVSVTVTPLTTAAMAAAQADARKRLENLEAQARERKESGLALDGLPDLADDGDREGQYQALLIHSLAARHITAWSGIEDDPPVSRENVAALMDLYPVGERFIQEFTLQPGAADRRQKTHPGLSADGTSSQAAGPDTAKTCEAEGALLRPRRPRPERPALPLSRTRAGRVGGIPGLGCPDGIPRAAPHRGGRPGAGHRHDRGPRHRPGARLR